MGEKKIKRILRAATPEEQERHTAIREQILEEFPPGEEAPREESPPGIPTQVRQARQARGLSWYGLAKLAGIPNSNTIRDIEYGRDAQLSTLQAVARALGLRLELVEEIM